MTTDIARRLEPSTIDEAQTLAKAAAASGLYAVKTPEAALMILLTGRDLGLSASQAFRAIYVVSNKPVISADALVASVRRSGLCESWRVVESTAERCTIETRRRGEEYAESDTFTMEDAKRALLDRKDVWRQYPREMLRHRCAAALARRVYPDLVLGMYDPSEFGEAPMPATVSVVEAEEAPAPQPKPSRGLTDAQKASLAVPILAAYDAGIERGENPDALYEVAHTAAKTAGIATYVQAQLRDRVATAAAARRAEIASAAEVIDRLNADLANANDTPAAIVAAWLDSSDAVRRLAEEDRQKAWSQAEAAWGVSGAAGSLRDAVKAESAKRAR